jgi:hypothetical protein
VLIESRIILRDISTKSIVTLLTEDRDPHSYQFVGLFKWVVMTFGLKNVGAMYQRAMNLIFHDLLRVLIEVYINDVVVKSVGFTEYVTDLK